MNLFTVQGNLSIDASNIYIDGQKVNDLSLCHITSTEYHKLVKDDACLSNMLYVVDGDDFVNAYDMKIKNVDIPVDGNDAVNLKYANDNYMSKNIEIIAPPTKTSQLENDIGYVVESDVDSLVRESLRKVLSALFN